MNDLDSASQSSRRALHRDPVDPPPSIRAGRAPLGNDRVLLEPIDPARHGDELFAIGHADDAAAAIWTYLPYGPFATADAMRDWLRNCAAAADPLFFALRDTATGELGGMASFLEIRPPHGVIEIGHIWFAPPFQKSLQATESLYLLMRHAFDDLGNRRLEWKCNALNQASRRAALRLGFRFEGVFYNHLIVKGHNRDTAWYSILAEEWPAIRANFEAWLAADNFAADGRQRTSLGDLNRALW